jgi:hypothetical protein
MQKHTLTLATALGLGFVAACGSSKSTAPNTITYAATLSGANEKPNAITSNGTGTFTGTLDPTANTFSWTLNFSGLTSNATAAHIHGPADANTATGVIVNFAAPAGGTGSLTVGAPSGTATGSISLAGAVNSGGTISGDSLRKLLDAGLTYVNVHTTNNGAGKRASDDSERAAVSRGPYHLSPSTSQ